MRVSLTHWRMPRSLPPQLALTQGASTYMSTSITRGQCLNPATDYCEPKFNCPREALLPIVVAAHVDVVPSKPFRLPVFSPSPPPLIFRLRQDLVLPCSRNSMGRTPAGHGQPFQHFAP